ncbi:MAG: asparagine synthase C-terminal domain-containing protein [Methanocalculaceae archaeon]|jgi:asparagine synthase (glutamine-hydrolysing)|nr:asparagine synthase C-terminal domain-containing protein [Methanocalculaceae archaeon]
MGALMLFRGWIEEKGRVLAPTEVVELTPGRLCRCGGEFVLATDRVIARDRYGIMPGEITPGVIQSPERDWQIIPDVPDLSLEDAVLEAVRLRCDDSGTASVVTLSGGVDSTLIAVLADLPCIAVGFSGSHDLTAAIDAADRLDLSLTVCEITEDDLINGLSLVRAALLNASLMDIELALVDYFIGRTAKACGAEKVLTGQAADELFGGYTRYGRSCNLRADLDADFTGLAIQRVRGSTAVGLSGVWYSMPYMDERVVRVSRKFANEELVASNLRKIALRKVAMKYLPEDLAWKPKKAMQYGSGITAALRRVEPNSQRRASCAWLSDDSCMKK